MRRSTLLAAAAAFAAKTVSAHGNITSPPARLPGPAMLAACGQTAVNTVLGDGTIALEEVKASSALCKVDLCRGAVFEDNINRVQLFTPGQVVVVTVALPIPHEGPANVSIVQTATNQIVGDMLLVFDTYADEKLAELPANNTAFGVTLPSGKAGEAVAAACPTAGSCVLQWWWLGTGAKQTYESCVDFVLTGTPGAAAFAGIANGTVAAVGAGAATPIGVSSVSSGGSEVVASNPEPAVVEPQAQTDEAAAEPAVDGAFGGVQGAVSDVGADVEAGESFGGVSGSVPLRRRWNRRVLPKRK
ncbi:hypothetical protein B0T25DRAFT_518336 [Lasiosphaeria hispida]|uniref:Chitin-binding type-4 domain-containing protein n=1 Tax=Lasiosphaeria hispida TaxID=260671 RepID=A0AAJ0HIY1_9PEZI|nr:hypothetical protein B0T25DRAFT_518336 [Lasiosphaeria hispida]